MSAGMVSAILLGLAALVTSVWGIYTQSRDRDLSASDKRGKIQLDDTTRTRLAAEAAQINSDERIATERWWKEQFDAVKAELVQEQRLRREGDVEVRRLTVWANEHQRWDQNTWELARQVDPACPPPPVLQRG
jgi:hypothetical protein